MIDLYLKHQGSKSKHGIWLGRMRTSEQAVSFQMRNKKMIKAVKSELKEVAL